jgi:hypothetical protein
MTLVVLQLRIESGCVPVGYGFLESATCHSGRNAVPRELMPGLSFVSTPRGNQV